MVEERAAEAADHREKTLDRRIRAFHWVRLLAEVPERLAGTEGEREAARRVEAFMHEIGFQEVGRGAAAGEPERAARLGLHLGVGALGACLGGTVGVLLLGVAALSLGRELRGGRRWLSRLLPAPESTYVVARAGSDRPRRRIVLSASLDAPRAGRLFSERLAGPVGARGARTRLSGGPLVVCERTLLFGALWAAAAVLGASGAVFDVVGIALAGVLLLSTAIAIEWARAGASPGANDASAVAALLTAGEQLHAQLRDDSELWLVAGGAGHAGATGLRAVLEAHPEWRSERTILLHFDRVGGEHLHYLDSEGALVRRAHSPRLRELARRLVEGGAYGDVAHVDFVGETDARCAVAAGLHSLAFVSLDDSGALHADHLPDDVPESLEMETVVRAADFGAAIVVASWRGESDPLAIV